MICLTITNSSELVASKVGQFLEKLTPESVDQTIVEKKILEKILESLSKEGLEGSISLVKGIEIKEKEIIFNKGVSVIEQSDF